MTRRGRSPDRWASYADGTRVDHFEWWARTYCVQSIDRFAGQPLILEGFQVEFLSEALAVTGDGAPYWRSIVLVLPRKNGKTTLLSAYGTYHAEQDDGQPEVLFAAASDKQADRLFEYATSFIAASPHLSGAFHVRDYVGEVERVDGGAKLLRMSSKPNTLHGYNPSLVIADELAQWTTPTLRKAFAALTTGGGARDAAQLFSITTAGEAADRDDSILGRMIDSNEQGDDVERPHEGLTISRNHDARVLIVNYSAPVSRRSDPVRKVKRANPASWITEDYLARQQANPELEDEDFLQLHACVWAQSRQVYIGRDDWVALGDGEPIGEGRRCSLGIDGSRTYDTTVVGWASKADDGRVDVGCRVFSVRQEAPHHVWHEGGRVDFEDVEDYVVDRFEFLRPRGAGYDPRFVDRSADLLERRLPEAAIMAIEPTSAHMRNALGALYRGVADGTVRHDGDPVLAAHVAAAKGEQDERGWVVRKRKQRNPIDALIAVAIAFYIETVVNPTSVYERKGLTVL